MDFIDILREKAFLGREFLTWLWFKSTRTGGIIETPGGRSIEVYFLDRLTLDLTGSETPQSVSIRGEHSELREGIAALREGKKIEEGRLSFKAGDNDFTTVLKATWFCFGSFRTPPILPSAEMDEDEGDEGRFLEKVALIEEGMDIIDDLFHYFLRLRISDDWEAKEVPALRRWIASDGE
ncbi:MAG: hypothetical protein V2B18_15905 [Pseudomonadota bacterium]